MTRNTVHRFTLGNPHGEENPAKLLFIFNVTMKSLYKEDKRNNGPLSTPNARNRIKTLTPEHVNLRSCELLSSLSFATRLDE